MMGRRGKRWRDLQIRDLLKTRKKGVLRLRGKACNLRTHIPQICFVAVNYSVENCSRCMFNIARKMIFLSVLFQQVRELSSRILASAAVKMAT